VLSSVPVLAGGTLAGKLLEQHYEEENDPNYDSQFNSEAKRGDVMLRMNGGPWRDKLDLEQETHGINETSWRPEERGITADSYAKHATTAPPTLEADEQGLQKAYQAKSGTSYDPLTKSLYVRGTVNSLDWLDNARHIGTGNTAGHNIYHKLHHAYGEHVKAGHHVKRVVGHSAGGAAAAQFQSDLHDAGVHVGARTFGAPIVDLGHRSRRDLKPDRYRNIGDPVSVFDRGARIGGAHINPLKAHGYQGHRRT
jgi:hypothetical protein